MDEEKLARRIDRFLIIYVLTGSLLMLFQILAYYFQVKTNAGQYIFEKFGMPLDKFMLFLFAVNLMNVLAVGFFSANMIITRKNIRAGIIGILAVGLYVFYIYLGVRGMAL